MMSTLWIFEMEETGMKLQRLAITLLIAMGLTLVPLSVFAAVTQVTINNISNKAPGESVAISGTTVFSSVVVKVIRPDNAVLYLHTATSASGTYSDSFTLPINAPSGTYSVVVGQNETVAVKTFIVVINH